MKTKQELRERAQEAVSVTKVEGFTQDIPQSTSMVGVKALLSETDKEYAKSQVLMNVAVQSGDRIFLAPLSLGEGMKVPSDAQVLRNEEAQIMGTPVVTGG